MSTQAYLSATTSYPATANNGLLKAPTNSLNNSYAGLLTNTIIFSDDFNSDSLAYNKTSFIAGWTVTDGSVDLIGEANGYGYFPANGNYIDLDGTTFQAGYFTKSLNLLAGMTYTASFELAGNHRDSLTDTVQVSFGNNTQSYLIPNSAEFSSYSLTFIPSFSGSFSLTFHNLGGDNIGALLDNIIVESSVFTDVTPPVVAGIEPTIVINDTATATPFSTLTISDDSQVTARISLDDAAKGVFTAASLAESGFSSSDGGLTYTHPVGTPLELQTALQTLVYQPTANRVAVGSTETTTFTISISDLSANTTTITAPDVVSVSVNNAPQVITLNVVALFSAIDGVHGRELWVTNGTTEGTMLLKDIYVGENYSNPNLFTIIDNGKAVFPATDEFHGRELWISDGTLAGTTLLKDIHVGLNGSVNECIDLGNGKAVFSADDGIHGNELWVTDGTEAGTTLVKDLNVGLADSYPNEFLNLGNGKVVFSADDGIHGDELWITDGTETRTTLVKDINIGSDGSYASVFVNLGNGKAIFSAADKIYGRELWITDGTTEGTRLVKDINMGLAGSYASSFVNLGNGKAIFSADDRIYGRELWITDGTTEGTRLVKDLNVGLTDSYPNEFLNLGNGKAVFSADDGIHGDELWITDGTEAGTTLVKDINMDSAGSYASGFVNLGNGKAIFSANDGIYGEELWITDGTTEGTQLVKDIKIGVNDSSPNYFAALGDGRFVFDADDEIHCYELWITDGTAAGTSLLKDIRTGAMLSKPAPAASINIDNITTFIEQTSVAVTNTIKIHDPDGDADWNGGSLKVQITVNNTVDDNLTLPTTNNGGIWLDGIVLMADTIAIGTADAIRVNNDTAWTFTFNANATNTLVQATARAIQFVNNSESPSTLNRTVTFTATDKYAASDSANQIINVIAVNNAPELVTPAAITYIDTAFDDCFPTVTGALIAHDFDGDALTYYVGPADGGISAGQDDGNGTMWITNAYGTLTITKATGAYSFVANDAAIEALTTDKNTYFTVVVSDGVTSVSQTLPINFVQKGVTESLHNDVLTGSCYDDRFDALSGNDIIYALAGNDTINGGAGADQMIGGKGDDSYYVDHSGDVVKEARHEGEDTVYTYISYTLTDHVENIVVLGTQAITAKGNALNNHLTGNGVGSVLDGQAGHDNYYVSQAGDTIAESANNGWDTVISSIDYSLEDNLEELYLTGTENLQGYGNAENNNLHGNSGDNYLDGGLGADFMAGGAGNDTYIVDDTGDVIKERANEGNDSVYAHVSYTLPAHVENLHIDIEKAASAILVGTGNELNNHLTVEGRMYLSANAVLYGLGGDDVLSSNLRSISTLIGGEGNDSYTVYYEGDVVKENANEGIDTVFSHSVAYTLTNHVEHLTLGSVIFGYDGVSTGIGNALANQITGNSSDNVLEGRAGNDILLGGEGADVLIGGHGQDHYDLTETTPATDTVRITKSESLINSHDVIAGFHLSSSLINTDGVDKLDLDSQRIAPDSIKNGKDTGIIHSHSIHDGIISFDDVNHYQNPLALTEKNLDDVFTYLQDNIKNNNTVAFICENNTFVFQDNGTQDTLVELVGITANSLSNTGLATDTIWLV